MSGRGIASAGTPARLRAFDPVRLADLEYRAWVGYYLRRWPQVLIASIGLVRVGFGMSWLPTLHGAWLVLRANQLWAPYPDNDPAGATACMRRFYALVRLAYGEPANPAKAAELEVDWWRVHREGQYRADRNSASQDSASQDSATQDSAASHTAGTHAADDRPPAEELVQSLTRLYCYLYSEPESVLRPAALHRARAMDLSDRWVREGCQPDSGLLPLERAALVRAYAALLAAVHR